MTTTPFVRATVLATAVFLAAGCAWSSQGAASSSTSSAPGVAASRTSSVAPPASTTTPTATTPTASPTSQSMAEKYPQTPAGAEAFVRAFFATYNTASANPSRVAEFEAFTDPDCSSCLLLSNEIRQWAKVGARHDGKAVEVERIRPDGDRVDAVRLILVKQLAGTVAKPNGAVVQRIQAKDVKSAMTIRWGARGWAVVRLQPYEGEI